MKVDFLATNVHYAHHMRPVYDGLPKTLKGVFTDNPDDLNPNNITAVSSYGDYLLTKGDVIYFEHGAGFTYGNNHPSYAGSPGKDRVVLFCSINQSVHDKNLKTYPNASHAVTGSPKMDDLIKIEKEPSDVPVVALSFHWDCKVAPETRSAFPQYQSAVKALALYNPGYRILGHGHPLIINKIAPYYKNFGIEVVRNFDDVVRLADVYVCDNSSTQYEFAALDRPVVFLNSSLYRKKVNHGIRFWENICGIQVDHPWQLREAIRISLEEDPFQEDRLKTTELVYPYLGSSVKRTVKVIKDFLAPVSKDNGRGTE